MYGGVPKEDASIHQAQMHRAPRDRSFTGKRPGIGATVTRATDPSYAIGPSATPPPSGGEVERMGAIVDKVFREIAKNEIEDLGKLYDKKHD
ncbi:MAG: hypothetical protein H6799_03355 [Candidatus Nomurabacteria bacterium]|nr:MAG: hypothetical protein H6799_03355 [Candidatus Nomurabacteria bacterium]